MSKITLAEALDYVPVGRSKLYQDAAEGVFTTGQDKRGRKVVDVAALEGAYGKLRNPQEDDVESETDVHGHLESSNGANPHPELSNGLSPHPSESVQLLELQVSMLEDQLSQATERERSLKAEKDQLTGRFDKLVDMLSKEQEKTRQFMLPPPPAVKGSIWSRFRFKK